MSSVYTPTSVALGDITIPADGDTINAASVNTALEALADGITAVRALTRLVYPKFVGIFTGWVNEPANTNWWWGYPNFTDTNPSLKTTDSALRWYPYGVQFREANTSSYFMAIDEHVVDGQTLSSVVASLKPAAHGALPAVMPRFGVIRMNRTGTADLLLSTTFGYAVDASASAAAFEVTHDVTFTPDQNNVIDRSLYSYALVFVNEGGANSAANGDLYPFRMVFA